MRGGRTAAMGTGRILSRAAARAAAALLACVLVFFAGTGTAWARSDWPSDTGILAEGGIVMDMDSETVLFGQQIHVAFPPASITKLLTALVTAEHASPDEVVTFSHDAVYNVEEGSGNKLSLEEGDQLTVRDCLYVLLLQSSNQTANALAEHVAGSREAFVDLMNETAAALGCTESHFANPSGLNDDAQYVTAYDMARIAAAAFENDLVLEVSSARSHTIPATINNPDGVSFAMEHRILTAEDPDSEYYCEGARAGKTGYTSLAGNTLVTLAERDGRRLVSVILKGTQPQYYMDTVNLLEFGFAGFKNETAAGQEDMLSQMDQLEAQGAVYPVSELRLEEDAVVTLPKDAAFSDAEKELVRELPADAPADAAAMIQYTYNTRKIGSVYILAESLAAQAGGGAGAAGADGVAGADGADEPGRADGSDGADETGGQQNPEADGTAPGDLAGGEDPENGSGGPGAGVLAFLLAAAAVGGAGVWLALRRKREREEQEKRRRRRLARLQEIGCSQEEFERLVNQRKTNGKRNIRKK